MEQLISQLKSSQKEIRLLLASVADDQDWQPDQNQWSFRYIAAHMATVENDCYQDRVVRIAAGEKPHYESYFNTGRNFSQFDLMKSLNDWTVTRQEIIGYVNVLAVKELSFSGTHSEFGTIKVLDVLEMMLDHDQEHLQALHQLINEYKMK
jgi:hypothetical protein